MDLAHRLPELIPFKLEVPPGASYVPFLIVTILAFIIVVWFVIKLIPGPMIRGILTERQTAIQHASDQVDSTLRETAEMRDDYRSRLEGIAGETQRRMNDAVTEAGTLRETILAEAKVTAAAIVRRGEDEVLRERAKAMVTLRKEFVEDVIRAAEYAAQRSLDGKQQQRLVGDFVKQVRVKQ